MSERICAVVVSYNRKACLRKCLQALQGQSYPLCAILVVNNASTDGTPEMLACEFPHVTLLNLPENTGGAGGFHAGMAWACQQPIDWMWIMDDDCAPAVDCLQQMMAYAEHRCVLVPVEAGNSTCEGHAAVWRGRITTLPLEKHAHRPGPYMFGFVGPLLPREMVKKAGLPVQEFFIWYDDVEYALRLQRLGCQSLLVPEARIRHVFGAQKRVCFLWHSKTRGYYPPWKVYYGARNALYTLTRRVPDAHGVRCYILDQFRYLLGDLLYEPERWHFMHMRLRGMVDGAFGRLGRRV